MPPRLRKASEKAEALSLNDMVLSGSDEEEAQDEQHELESKTRARSVPSRQVKKAKPAEKGKAQAVVKAKGAKRRASSPPPEQPAKKKKVSKGNLRCWNLRLRKAHDIGVSEREDLSGTCLTNHSALASFAGAEAPTASLGAPTDTFRSKL